MHEQINKMWSIPVMEYYSALKKELLAYAATWMSLEDVILKLHKPVTKGQILCDSTETGSRIGYQRPRGGEQELVFLGHRVSVRDDE